MAKGFRRSLLGYDRDSVKEAIASRDERLKRLEREAGNLAQRILDRERRLKAALGRLGEKDDSLENPDAPGAITALSRRLEDIHAQARKQATRIRMRALRDAVQIADRVTEMAGLREMMDAAGLRPFAGIDPEEADLGGDRVSAAARQGFFEGEVEVEIGPLKDFAALSSIEDAANEIGAAGEIKVKGFSGGRATLSMDLGEPVELLRELEERAALEFHVRSLQDDRVVLDVDADDEAAAA